MKCKNCGCPLVIDEWNGWVWACLNCGKIERAATKEEIEEQENRSRKPKNTKTLSDARKDRF